MVIMVLPSQPLIQISTRYLSASSTHEASTATHARTCAPHVITSMPGAPGFRRLKPPVLTPPRVILVHYSNTHYIAATMDTDMTDAAYDIDIDAGGGIETTAQQPQPVLQVRCSAKRG